MFFFAIGFLLCNNKTLTFKDKILYEDEKHDTDAKWGIVFTS